MEYTILTLISIIIVLVLDQTVFKYKFTSTRLFWRFYFIMFVLHNVVDNYLNGRWGRGSFIVGNYKEYSGINLLYTPIENYFFGFSLILLNILIFTYLEKKFLEKNKQNKQRKTN